MVSGGVVVEDVLGADGRHPSERVATDWIWAIRLSELVRICPITSHASIRSRYFSLENVFSFLFIIIFNSQHFAYLDLEMKNVNVNVKYLKVL